jgi:hypothetical protein
MVLGGPNGQGRTARPIKDGGSVGSRRGTRWFNDRQAPNDQRAKTFVPTRRSSLVPTYPTYIESTLNSVRRLRWCSSSEHFVQSHFSLGSVSPYPLLVMFVAGMPLLMM